MKKNLQRYGFFFLCFFLLFTWNSVFVSARKLDSSTTKIQKSKQKVVRVGWYEDAYHITGENGEKSGYGYEYEQAVAAYTGWKYEYVKGEWSQLLKMLENGEIDLMGALSYTDERAKIMDFSELPMGKEKYYLYADLLHTDISASDLSTLNGKRIDMIKNGVQEIQFTEWEKNHHIKTEHVYTETFDDGKKKAENLEIDGVVSTETPQWIEFGMSAIATTGGSNIYYGINKKRHDLKEELNDAMNKMENDKPFYADELYKKYLSTVSSPVLSNEERDWLDEHGKIRIGYLKNDCGFSYEDRQGGKLVGVVNDYVKFASNSLGKQSLNFKLIGFDSQDEQIQALKDNRIDMIFHFSQNPYIAEQKGITLSNTVLSVNMAAVTSKGYFDENAKNSVAIEEGNLLLKWHISYHYPKWKIKEYESLEEVEEAVRDGKADCFLVESGRLEKYIEEKKLHTVFLTQSEDTSFAVNLGNTILLSILNKTLKTMQSSMLTGALSMYDNTSKKISVIDFVKDNLVIVATVFISVFLFVLILILVLLRKSRIAEAVAKEAASKTLELNQKLQENHHELQETLLRAERANSAKTTFLNNMSHDIRTPMNAIIGFTNIALKQTISDVVRNCLEKISDSSDLLLTLINDVLDISRIESGHMKFNLMTVDITAVTDMALNITYGLLANRNIDFCVNRMKVDQPYVLADAVRLREILVNILSNAVKFTDDGGTITFASSNRLDADKKQLIVRYVISDTGIGMSQEFQKCIFDEFSQEESDARTQYKGTGLGMAITKRYVDMMGGTISLQSEKNKGTVFIVEIPFKSVSKKDIPQKDIPVDFRNLAGIHVLLAEDNDLNAEIVTVQLEEVGIKVTRASDGQEAVALFENSTKNTFDIILMDIMMPKMNGYQATKAIRDLPQRRDGYKIPIIALTANAFAEDVQASMDAGMNSHVSKPIVMDELIKAIARNVDR